MILTTNNVGKQLNNWEWQEGQFQYQTAQPIFINFYDNRYVFYDSLYNKIP
ncbi:hypothetical protein [Pontibacillus yanchengensis]|uniref:hypothetical protein n=1 Tax=Pontibacillus yanchengensis TaxID=462910 RepID=UPI001367CC17|nr:hypothetical protein [Pontibacillus yanchengensis]